MSINNVVKGFFVIVCEMNNRYLSLCLRSSNHILLPYFNKASVNVEQTYLANLFGMTIHVGNHTYQ